MKFLFLLILAASVSTLVACGGGGTSSSAIVFEGTLTQGGKGGSTGHLLGRHSEGERIGGVAICALQECSTTDDEGQWGFAAPESFRSGPVHFTVQGHGIDSHTIVTVPEGASNVVLDFLHQEGEVNAEHITIDEETQHFEVPHHEL